MDAHRNLSAAQFRDLDLFNVSERGDAYALESRAEIDSREQAGMPGQYEGIAGRAREEEAVRSTFFFDDEEETPYKPGPGRTN